MSHHHAKYSSLRHLLCVVFPCIVLLGLCAPVHAVSAWPGSGLVGDEWYHYRADTASESTRRNAPRVAAERRARFAEQAVQASFPLTGVVRSIVILVSYSDLAFTVENPNEAFTRLLNEPGYSDNGATGSAADYFRACSYNQFQPVFDVYGPYVLPKKRSYYGANDAQGNDKNALDMIVDACQLADADGVDFSQYDTDGDGVVDNIFVYYAGTNPAEGGPRDAIWPHRSIVWRDSYIDGKRLYDYACTSELSLLTSRDGTMCGIGTFCHEFGHVLGLPDLYNTANGEIYTVGEWDIMAGGNYNNNGNTPPSYSSYERFALGWLTPVQLQDIGDYTLEPLCEQPQAYLLAAAQHNLQQMNPNPSEYWLVENRQHVGWDAPAAAIPGVGLLISHITHVTGRWYENTYNNSKPLGYDICEAYNQNPVRATASDTYPGTVGVTTFTPKQNNGTELLNLQLSRIREIGENNMFFHFGEQDGNGFVVEPQEIPVLYDYILDHRSYPQPVKLHVTATNLEADRVYMLAGSGMFSVSSDSVTWHTDTLWLPVTSEPFDTTVYVRYTGTRQCRQVVGAIQLGTSARTYSTQLSVIGYAERPNMLTDIELREPYVSSPYSFVARWVEQPDAEVYYLTLCTWKDEVSEMTQDFEQFLTEEKIAATGWQCNFLRTTSTHYDGRTALLLTTAGDQITSEQYLCPVSQISYWISQSYLSGEQDSGGTLLVEASDGNAWHQIAELKLSPVTPATVKNYKFSEADNYVKFRFTCTRSSGEGGIILDGFTARMERTFEYLFRDKEYPVFAPADSVKVAGLHPGGTYSFQLCAVENKGCEMHSTPLTLPCFFTTPQGEDEKSNRLTIIVRKSDLSIYLNTLFRTGDLLYFFDLDGRLVNIVTPEVGSDECRLPLSFFDSGKQYVVKLLNDASGAAAINRKQPYGKMVIPR